MKFRDIFAAQGKHITKLFYGFAGHCVEIDVPNEGKLFNFEIKIPEVAHLFVLDPYGDDTFPSDLRLRIFGGVHHRTVAIEKKTGQICLVALFLDEEGELALLVEPWMDYCIPKKWRSKLKELSSRKRPFRCLLQSEALQDFITREIGYRDLSDHVVFSFAFQGFSLEVQGPAFRRVGDWERD